jgi:glycosyltransferase involved in cell wall biosynthesis
MSPVVDIFIPTISNHVPYLKAALGSALYQSYPNTRIVMWVEDPDADYMKQGLRNLWSEPGDLDPYAYRRKGLDPYTIEECGKGLLVRNYLERTGNASLARQWLFDWKGKSDYVKTLDSDDMLLPSAISVMMRYMTEDVDMVLCPMIPIQCHRICPAMKSIINKETCGSGSMLMSKKFIEKINVMGFRWPNMRGHDKAFNDFLKEHLNDFKIVTTSEDALYLYIKNLVYY